VLINRPCSLVYRFVVDDDELGNDVFDETWIPAVCEVQQRQADEEPTGSSASSEWIGFFLPGLELEAVDAVNVPGAGWFEVFGDPSDWRSPIDSLGHIEARLRRTGPGAEEGS
jgi:hypothetical protein